MGEFYTLKISALDGFDAPVVRVNAEGMLTYVNRAAQDLIGIAPDQRPTLRMLFPDEYEYTEVSRQLSARLNGELANYKTQFRPPLAPAGAAPIPIRIYAFPDADTGGKIVGSIAILQDRRKETMRAAIHAAIERGTLNDTLFQSVAEQLHRIIDFDVFRVTAISRSRRHLRNMFSTDPNAKTDYPFRWWPMPAFIERDLDELADSIIDVDTLFAQPDYARMAEEDEPTRVFLRSGIKSILNLPVLENGRLVAIMALDAFRPHAFHRHDRETLDNLPIVQAVTTALYRERRIEHDAVFDLLRQASTHSHDVKRVAEELVKSLVGQGWDHVSIFQSDEARNAMRLVCQANSEKQSPLPDQCCLKRSDTNGEPDNAIAAAVLGGHRVEEFSSRARGPFRQLDSTAPAGSQLVVPIRGERERWALNVESTMRGSFADEEIRLLELLAAEAAGVLHRSSMFELQAAVLRSINDAVIETDGNGNIRWSNEAAQQMLHLPKRLERPLPFTDLVADPALAAILAQYDKLDHRELELRALDGKTIPVLLSISTLPDHLGGRVHVASDFTFQKEVQRLSELKEVFQLAAAEGRIPLSLATIWLRQHAEQTPEIHATMEKVMAQLGRADLPLERLLRLFSQESSTTSKPCCDLVRAVHTTLAELPDTAQLSIRTDFNDSALPVKINFEDLQFCVESMISFGLRTQPQSKHLFVKTGASDSHAYCRVWGDWHADFGDEGGTGSTERWRRKYLSDLTFGERVIERLVEGVGGNYQRSFDPALSFQITLPFA